MVLTKNGHHIVRNSWERIRMYDGTWMQVLRLISFAYFI